MPRRSGGGSRRGDWGGQLKRADGRATTCRRHRWRDEGKRAVRSSLPRKFAFDLRETFKCTHLHLHSLFFSSLHRCPRPFPLSLSDRSRPTPQTFSSFPLCVFLLGGRVLSDAGVTRAATSRRLGGRPMKMRRRPSGDPQRGRQRPGSRRAAPRRRTQRIDAREGGWRRRQREQPPKGAGSGRPRREARLGARPSGPGAFGDKKKRGRRRPGERRGGRGGGRAKQSLAERGLRPRESRTLPSGCSGCQSLPGVGSPAFGARPRLTPSVSALFRRSFFTRGRGPCGRGRCSRRA